jgi:phage shock protein PspC (stress-responsive transcriptional regulator)
MQNNPQKFWFKRKRIGWGWAPCSLEGWLVLLIYLILMLRVALRVDQFSHSGSDVLFSFAVPFVGLTLILIIICYIKGEEPRWQWNWRGENFNNNKNNNNMKTYDKKLYKSEENKVFFGVLGGLGEYFDIDPVIFRVFYLAFSAFTGVAPGILAYLLMAMVMPKKSHVMHVHHEHSHENHAG